MFYLPEARSQRRDPGQHFKWNDILRHSWSAGKGRFQQDRFFPVHLAWAPANKRRNQRRETLLDEGTAIFRLTAAEPSKS